METVSEVREWLKEVQPPRSPNFEEFTAVVNALHDAKGSIEQRSALRAALKYFHITRSRSSKDAVLLNEAHAAVVRKGNAMRQNRQASSVSDAPHRLNEASSARNTPQVLDESVHRPEQSCRPQRADEPQQQKRQPPHPATDTRPAAKARADHNPHKRDLQPCGDAEQLASSAQSNEDQPPKKVRTQLTLRAAFAMHRPGTPLKQPEANDVAPL